MSNPRRTLGIVIVVAVLCEAVGLVVIHLARAGESHPLATAWTYALSGIVAIVILVSIVWLLPEQASSSWGDLRQKDQIELRDKFRSTIVGLIGGIALVTTFAISLYQVNQSRHDADATLHATNEGQLQDRLASAIDHMGAEDSDGDRLIDVRVGGIYQLGRFGLAGANARVDAAAILTAYVRDNASVQTTAVTPMSEVANCGPPRTSVAADITAVLEQLRRLYPVDEDRPPDRGLDLSNSDLSDADLEGIDLRNANLSNARLIDANLINVDLREARLTHVDARFACFGLAKLARANFDSAGQADEQRLREEASNLEHAQFNSADLTAVEMSYADLRGATMVDANVDRADFSGADSSGLRWQSNHGVPRFCPPLAAGCRDAR